VVFDYIRKTLSSERGRDRMVLGFTTTYPISVYHHCKKIQRSDEKKG